MGMQNGEITLIDVLRFLIAKAPGCTAVQLAVAIYAEKSANQRISTRSPTHKSQPDAGGGELDEREVVGVVLFEASGDSSEVLNLVEEALDEIAEAMKETTEGGDVDAPGHGFDVGPGSASSDALAQDVAVVGTVTEENLTFSKGVEQVGGTLSIVGLAFGDLQGDRIAVGVHQSVDLGCQSTSRAPHASGSRVVPSGGAGALLRPPFLPLAAC